jgi:hypothetical protein
LVEFDTACTKRLADSEFDYSRFNCGPVVQI